MKDKIKEYENQLKPCPFCSGKMRIDKTEEHILINGYDFICNTENCILNSGFKISVDEGDLPEHIAKFNQGGKSVE